MILERRPAAWAALSNGSCGILARAMVGQHDEDFTLEPSYCRGKMRENDLEGEVWFSAR